MYSYIIGKIISINKKSITLENSYVGYVINVAQPKNFQQGKIQKIYLYKHCYLSNKNAMQEEFYGFKIYDEKEFFLNCINISGIGPKTAISFLKNDIEILKKLIINKDINALEQLQGINKKYAYILIEYLADFCYKNKTIGYDNLADVINVLKTLGYKPEDINFAINKLNEEKAIENTMETADVVSLAIKIISTKNETSIPKA